MQHKKIIIIGGVAAGMSAASEIKRRLPQSEVTVLTNEETISYGACGMPFVLSKKISNPNDLIALSPANARDRGINLLTSYLATEINKDEKYVLATNLKTEKQEQFDYNFLIFATGAKTIVPEVEGISLPGVFSLKAFEDVSTISQFISAHKPKTATIIGAGFIGLEMIEALFENGIKITVVSQGILDKSDTFVNEKVIKLLESKGIICHLSNSIKSIEGGDKVNNVVLHDGTSIQSDMVCFGIGVVPNSIIASQAGLELDIQNTIKVDDYLRTSDPSIFAAGDCVASRHLLLQNKVFFPLGLKANREGKTAGINISNTILGKELQIIPPILGSYTIKVFNLEIGKTGVGQYEIYSEHITDIESVTVHSRPQAGYYNPESFLHIILYFNKTSEVVVGAQIIGSEGSVLRLHALSVAIQAKMTLSELYDTDLAYSPPFSPVWDPILIAARKGLTQ